MQYEWYKQQQEGEARFYIGGTKNRFILWIVRNLYKLFNRKHKGK